MTAGVERKEVENRVRTGSSVPSGEARLTFAVAILLFVVLNVVTGLLYSSTSKDIRDCFTHADLHGDLSGRKEAWSWWLARAFLAEPSVPDVVVFGSSQMGAAQSTVDADFLNRWVDVLTHKHIRLLESEIGESLGKCPSIFSLALPGAMISDQYLMTKALFRRDSKPRLVIATVAPRDFIDATMPYPGATDQFKFFSRYVDLENLETAAYNDPLSYLELLASKLPIRKAGITILQPERATDTGEANTESATAVLAAISAAPADVGTNKWVVPPHVDTPWIDNTIEYKRRFKGPNMRNYESELAFFKAWLAFLRQEGIEVLVIGMPSMECNRRLLPDSFWLRMRQDISLVCRTHRVDFVDYTDSPAFSKEDYLDTVHLKSRGGKKLFGLLAKKMESYLR